MLREQKNLLAFYGKNPEKIGSWNDVSISDKEKIRKTKIPRTFGELRITSGSTGEPLYVFYSKEAVNSFLKRAVISLKKSGVSSKDHVLNLFAYGNYIPGSMYERACQMENIPVLPLGAPNTYPKEKVIEVIMKLRPNVWLSVPSYAISLLDALAENKNKDSFPEKIIIAGERLWDVYIEKFKKYNIEIVNHFGLTECPAIGVSKKGDPSIIEMINEGIYTESITGTNGEQYFVVTDLNNFATPIIRYRTGDTIDNVKHNKDGSLKEISIIGRGDDLVKIQGVLVSKTKIVEILSKFTDKFVVNIITKKHRDFVEVFLHQSCEEIKAEIDEQLAFLKKKELFFRGDISVPKTISYKNKHIVDLRR